MMHLILFLQRTLLEKLSLARQFLRSCVPLLHVSSLQGGSLTRSHDSSLLNILCALSLSFLLIISSVPFSTVQAYAEEISSSSLSESSDDLADDLSQKTAYELKQELEESQSAYDEARAEANEAAELVSAQEERIADIEKEIPEQQKRSSAATRELYKVQQQSIGLLNMFLNATSFGDFLTQVDYVSRIVNVNYQEINRLKDLKSELAATREQLKTTQEEANQRVEEARSAMEASLAAQAEAQERAQEEARIEAEAAANAEALAESPRDNTEASESSAASDAGQGAESTDASAGTDTSSGDNSSNSSSMPDSADTSDEASFINKWAPRIDAYLAGSPLAGQGATFARAAYIYNVDPRFSPAISCIESGKGTYCFLPHNAWGWGSVSWDSWEEAIYDHVRGLSRGYGYTITVEGAKKYCPPNWEYWYNTTLSQMNLI